MIVKKSPAEIDAMAAAGDILVRCMDLLAGKIRPGVTTGQLDEAAERFIRSQGATPAFKGYRGFPGSICASPNHMVVHGIPGDFKLGPGDILSVDIGVVKDGWVADAARTFGVGAISPAAAIWSISAGDLLMITAVPPTAASRASRGCGRAPPSCPASRRSGAGDRARRSSP